MNKTSYFKTLSAICIVLALVVVGSLTVFGQKVATQQKTDVTTQQKTDETKKPPLISVIKGKPGGIEVGNYAVNFELEPIDAHPDYKRWLGDKAPKSIKDKVMLSDFVGKAPIILLFGSYT